MGIFVKSRRAVQEIDCYTPHQPPSGSSSSSLVVCSNISITILMTADGACLFFLSRVSYTMLNIHSALCFHVSVCICVHICVNAAFVLYRLYHL